MLTQAWVHVMIPECDRSVLRVLLKIDGVYLPWFSGERRSINERLFQSGHRARRRSRDSLRKKGSAWRWRNRGAWAAEWPFSASRLLGRRPK